MSLSDWAYASPKKGEVKRNWIGYISPKKGRIEISIVEYIK